MKDLSPNAEKLLNQRYYHHGEDWGKLVERVTEAVVGKENLQFRDRIYRQIFHRVWLPNSPCLVNAGKSVGGLVACFTVGPDEDTLENHFDILKDIAMVAKHGGGCGFSGTNIRRKGAIVGGSSHEDGRGIAYGPVWFGATVERALQGITQGGFRSMALMFTMNADHDDIEEFIKMKQGSELELTGFNQSVFAKDEWLKRAFSTSRTHEAKMLNLIAESAWNNGEPGLLFASEINRGPYKTCSCPDIITTNPCCAAGTLVNTPYGYTLVENIKKGDFVSTLLGYEPVEEVKIHENISVYRVSFSDGGEQIVTEDHRYHVIDGRKVTRRRLTDIKVGDFVQVRPSELINAGRTSDYLYGLKQGILVGDGCYTEKMMNRNVIKIASNIREEQYNENLKKLFGITRKPWVDPRSNAVHLTFSGAIDTLTDLDLKPAYSHEKSIDVTKIKTKQHAYGFLDGLLATDGNINLKKDNPQIRWTTTSKELANNIRQIGMLIGLHARIYRKSKRGGGEIDNRKIAGNHDSYVVMLVGKHAKLYAENSALDELHPEKGAKLNSLLTDYHLIGATEKARVTSIEYAGKSDVYDLYCSKSDSWITEGYVQQGCSEQPLPSYGACVLGSINIAHDVFYDNDGHFNWQEFKDVIRDVTRFLDNVGSVNVFPNDKFQRWYEKHRPIGVGIMGFADALLRLRTAYGSDESIKFASKIAEVLTMVANNESKVLGEERGVPEHCEAVGRRNITTTTIAPTGSIATIADCSHGIEPVFAESYIRTDEREEEYLYEHPLRDEPFFRCSISDNKKLIPDPISQIKIQAAMQKFINSGISKTINLPHEADVETVKDIMNLAWKSGLKGIAVYRNGSREKQILNANGLTEEDALNSSCISGVCEI